MHLRRVFVSVVVWLALLGSIVPLTARAQDRSTESRTFIVLLDAPVSNVDAVAAEISRDYAGHDVRAWQALNTFSVVISRRAAAQLRFDARVTAVMEDVPGKLSAEQPTKYDPSGIHFDSTPKTTARDNRLWHLDRIDQERLPLDHVYHYCTTGRGVYVYHLDLGVMRAHSEFGATDDERSAHVLDGYDAAAHNSVAAWTCQDFHPDMMFTSNGHGTATASLINGKNVGVAKDAVVIPIRTATTCGGLAGEAPHPANMPRFYRPGEAIVGPDHGTYVALNSGWSGTGLPALCGSSHNVFIDAAVTFRLIDPIPVQQCTVSGEPRPGDRFDQFRLSAVESGSDRLDQRFQLSDRCRHPGGHVRQQ